MEKCVGSESASGVQPCINCGGRMVWDGIIGTHVCQNSASESSGPIAIQCDRLIDETPTEALSWTKQGFKEWADWYCTEVYGPTWYYDGDPIVHFEEWRKRVRRRIEDAIRKDPQALMVCAQALNTGKSVRISLE